MRLAEVEQHDVGFLASLERADLVLHADGLRGIDGHHLQSLPGRQDLIVTEMAAVIMHGLLHVSDHVSGPIRRGRVRADSDGHALIDQLRHRAAALDRSDGGRVVHDAGTSFAQRSDIRLGQIGAVRQEGILAEQILRVMSIGDTAFAMTVLGAKGRGPAAHARSPDRP